ncbi:MAG: hypothetical protein AABW58_04170 [Nanoarchaeota archaeon]
MRLNKDRQKKLERKTVAFFSEEEKSRLYDLISEARNLFNDKYSSPEEISEFLKDITPYVRRAKKEESHLFTIILYHDERLRRMYKEKTGHKYKP